MASRKRLFLGVVAMAIAVGAGGYLLGRQLQSPEDARSEVAAPEPSLIAVPVEALALSNDVVVRGDAQYEGAVDLVLDAALGDGTSRVVTGRVPEVDSIVEEGDVLIEVSGRPVFVLEGALPAFREFKPGVEGDDVLQLEQALARLGFLTVEPDRLYGAATEDAIAAMYEAVGYEARAASATEEAALKTAEESVRAARTALANANDTLSQASKPPSAAEQLQSTQSREKLVEAITTAQEELDKVLADRPTNALLNAIDAVRLAEQTGGDVAGANQAVQAAQDAEQAAVDVAQERLDAAKQALTDYDALEAAKDSDGRDTSSQRNAVADAQERLADAVADQAELEEDVGVRLPVAEIVFLPELPRTVTSIDVERGDVVSTAAVMRISGTQVRIVTGVSEANRPLLEVGQQVVIDSEQLGIVVDGEIAELADRKGTNGAADTRYYMVVTPTGEHSVNEMVGINFRMQIPLERSEGEVLAVPLAALSAGADGSSRVEVLNDDGTTRLVEITVGLQDKNKSLVEITPIDGNIAAGDLVVIGVENPVTAPSDEDAETDETDETDQTDETDEAEADDSEAGG